MERKIAFSVGEYYHVYNRGVDQREIFMDTGDRERFIRLLYLANGDKPYTYRLVQGLPLNEIDVGEKKVAIGCYVLMPNHFHILVKEIKDGGLTSFMEKLTTGYSMYFNTKYKRSGALFQGRFKAEHVDRDEYLKYLFSYIHLNPVKFLDPRWKEKGIVDLPRAKKYLEEYEYSSYQNYAGTAPPESPILSRKEFPEYFQDKTEFSQFVDEWLTYASHNPTQFGIT